MKKSYIARLLSILAIVIAMAACQQQNAINESTGVKHAEKDTSLSYLLKPVNEQVIAQIPLIRAQTNSSVFIREVQGRIAYDTRYQINLASRVSGRIEKLYIKYNFQPVKKGELIMEIYSPDLAAAQRELLLIKESGNVDGMLNSAKQRLLLLGMNSAQINKVLRTGQINYKIPVYSHATGFILEKQAAAGANPSPTNSGTGNDNMNAGSSAVLLREGQYLAAGENIFTIYRAGDLVAEFSLTPEVASQINKKTTVLIQRTANKEQTLTGKVELVQPVFNAGENFVLVRIYLKNSGLQPGEFVTGQIPLLSKKTLWLPKEAVVSIGNESVVFKKEGKVFIPKTIKTGITQNNQVEVPEEVREWDLAKNAYYLIDSESFIKTAKKEK